MPERSALQREIHQSVPFGSPEEEALLSIVRTSDVLRRRVGRVIEPYGITGQQYNVLRILRGAGCNGLPTLEITERMIEQSPGITRMIDRLEAKSLVRRQRGCEDRREVVCRITDTGLDLLAKLDAPIREANNMASAMLSRPEIEVLIDILARIRGGAECVGGNDARQNICDAE